MSNLTLMDRIISGVEAWNAYVEQMNGDIIGDLHNIEFPIGMDFTEIILPDVSFNHSSLEQAVFRNAVVRATRFEYTNLCNADFKGAKLGGVWMRRVDPGTILRITTYFNHANLSGANFSDTDANNVDFSNAILENTIFQNSNLTDANFRGAKLDGADFVGANLSGALFDETVPKYLRDRSNINEKIDLDEGSKQTFQTTNRYTATFEQSDTKQQNRINEIVSSTKDPERIILQVSALEEIRREIDIIRKEISKIIQSNIDKSELESDLKLIEQEIERPSPRRRFIKLFLESLRDNLAKAFGASMAASIVAGLAALIAKYVGIL